MGDYLDKAGRRPDGGHGPSGRATLRPEFWDFCWKSFLFESRIRTVRHCRPDSHTSTASNFLTKASRVWTRGMGVQTVDLLHVISISVERVSRPWQTGTRTVEFELRFSPYVWTRSDGNPRRPDGFRNLPLYELGKKSEASITESHPDGLLRRLNGCKLDQKLLDTEEGPDGNPRRPDGWCFGLSSVQTVWHVVRMAGTMDKWASGRDVTWSRRLAGNRNLWLVNSAESSEALLNREIPVKSIFTYKWFCPIRMRPITN